MRIQRGVKAGLALAVAGGVLMACSAGGQSSSGTPSGDDKPDLSATLTQAYASFMPSLDPIMVPGEGNGMFFLNRVYDRLFSVGYDNEIKPMLATKWAYGSDGLTLVIDLRDDVTFHDGTPLNADAVKVTLDRNRTVDSPTVKTALSAVKSVDVTGEYQVTLNLSSPVATLPYTLSSVGGFILNPKLVTDGDPAKTADGSGAYTVEEFIPNESETLVRSEDPYWDKDAANFAKIELISFSDRQAMVNSVLSGQSDLAELTGGEAELVTDKPGLQNVTLPVGYQLQLAFNRDNEFMKDLKIRQAINMAMDRDSIVKATLPGADPSYQMSIEDTPGYLPELDAKYAFDTAGAKQLLADAGYPDGIDLGTVYVASETVPGLAEALQQQFADAGIKMTLQVMEGNLVYAKTQSENAPFTIGYAFTGKGLIDGIQDHWYGYRNPAGTTSEFDALFNAANNNLLTPEERLRKAEAVQKFVVDEAWTAPIAFLNDPWGVSDKIRNFHDEMDYRYSFGPMDTRYVYKVAD